MVETHKEDRVCCNDLTIMRRHSMIVPGNRYRAVELVGSDLTVNGACA